MHPTLGRANLIKTMLCKRSTLVSYKKQQNLLTISRLRKTCDPALKRGICTDITVKKAPRTLILNSVKYFSTSSSSSIWFFGGKDLPPAIPEPSDTPLANDPLEAAPVDTAVDAAPTPDLTEVFSGVITDPPFIELGLASKWWPNHHVHQLLEWVHLNTDFPWWQTILLGTICIRVITLPLYIYTRKSMIRQRIHGDEQARLNKNISKAKEADDKLREMHASMELRKFWKSTGTGPIKGMLTSFAMPVVFISCVTAVRQMCAVPVPSMTQGGTLWFPNLVAPDPYYVLPMLTGVTITLLIRSMMKSATAAPAAMNYIGIIRKAQYLPIIGMPLLFGSSYSGIYVYWLTTCVITLGLQNALANPNVKKWLKMPEIPVVKEEEKNQGVVKTFKKMYQESQERAEARYERSQINKERKQRDKKRKKELKGKPPVTYTIGVDAMPKEREVPDFERDWKPPRPKHFGYFQ